MIQVPGYLIKREIGAGGMATVYLAVQTSLEREVALKVMNPAMVSDTTFSRRFMQEARTLASLAHPNIVAVYDVGITDEKLHYFSMQHLPHGDFLQRIREGVSEAEVLRVVSGVARALGYAHQRGFVHRDVAPGNVLFDMNASPVLTDFGIARAVSKTSRITNAGVSVGTSHYMSPEQARGGDVDGRSDLYSLGAVIFEALTGQAPYEGDDGFAIAYAHVFEPVPRLPAHLAHWQALIDKAMAKDPDQRFQNADEFQLALAEMESRLMPVASSTPVALGAQATLVMSAIPLNPATAGPASDPGATRQMAVPTAAAGAIGAELQQLRQQSRARPSAARPPAVIALGNARRLGWALGGVGIVAAVVLVGVWIFRSVSPSISHGVGPDAPAVAPPAAAVVEPVVEPQPPGEPVVSPPPAVATEDPATAVEPSALELLGVDADAQLRFAIETTVVDPVSELLRLAKSDLAGKRLTLPAGRNASDRYRQVLLIDADNAAAGAGLVQTAQALLVVADEQFATGNIDGYFETAARATDIAGKHDREGVVRSAVEARRKQLVQAALADADVAMARWDGKAARAAFARALHFEPANAVAKRGLTQADGVGQPGYAFSDKVGSAAGPELMVLRVAGKRLAVARNETTVAEFNRFWTAGGSKVRAARPTCRDRESVFRGSKSRTWQSPGFAQQATHPVVCVAYGDAEAYAAWLSKQSGKRYRLLSSAEWLAAAGKAADAGKCRANVADQEFNAEHRDRDALACSDGFAATAPVRRYDAPGGLYDTAGNVREWTSDCASNCGSRLAMGSAWLSTASQLDPGQRDGFDADTGFNTIGFRVAREID